MLIRYRVQNSSVKWFGSTFSKVEKYENLVKSEKGENDKKLKYFCGDRGKA